MPVTKKNTKPRKKNIQSSTVKKEKKSVAPERQLVQVENKNEVLRNELNKAIGEIRVLMTKQDQPKPQPAVIAASEKNEMVQQEFNNSIKPHILHSQTNVFANNLKERLDNSGNIYYVTEKQIKDQKKQALITGLYVLAGMMLSAALWYWKGIGKGYKIGVDKTIEAANHYYAGSGKAPL